LKYGELKAGMVIGGSLFRPLAFSDKSATQYHTMTRAVHQTDIFLHYSACPVE
jgi:hypothetical protein